MMRLQFLAALTATIVMAAPARSSPPPRPKLIVAISVDQFSADLFAEYRGRFTDGMRRLADGVVFPAGYQSHAATETCPGHSTILTGARPGRTGIVANTWFDLTLARPDKAVYCSEDPTVPGSSSTRYTPSVGMLRVPTLGDRMKLATPGSRVVAVAGKDRAAIMMGGHAVDQLWFWGDDGFRTLGDRTAPAPSAVGRINALTARQIARVGTAPLSPRCAARAGSVAVAGRTVGTVQPRAAGDRRGFRATPAFDAAVADLALALLGDLRLGRGPATDLLIVGLSATDYVGHAFGTEGVEMCAQMAALDMQIGRLLAALDATGIPYAVALTADHGGIDLPERSAARGVPAAARVDAALLPDAVDAAVRAEFGLTARTVYGDGPFGDIYVARDLPAGLRPRVVSAVKARYLASPQVEAVFTREEIARVDPARRAIDEWSLVERVAAGFDPARSGDLYVVLKPDVMPIPAGSSGSVTTHGSPWNRDRRVPILFWWPGARGFEQPHPVETVDILPTLAALIGLDVPAAEIDGRCLDLDADAVTSCTAPR